MELAKKNGNVIEMANRASIQKLSSESLSGITLRLDNHESGLNINAHQIGNVAGLQTALNGKEPVFSKNTAFNKNFGTVAGTVCQGNDSRLSNARIPTAHTHAITDVTGLQAELGGKADTFIGFTGSVTVVTGVNFGTSTATTAIINIDNGIITSIS